MKNTVVFGNDGYHYTVGYFTANKWLDSNNLVAARSKYRDIGQEKRGVELVKISISDKKITVISDNLSEWGNYVVFESKVYYLTENEIRVFDFCDKSDKILYKSAECLPGSPHITADGRYISLFSYNEETHMRAFRFDTKSLKLEEMFGKKFRDPFPIANHVMINPKNENVFFFAHEGDTRYISNRLWLFDDKGMRNIASQKLNFDGELEDCFGHETWAPSGKGIYFIKYDLSLSEPYGISYVNIETNETKVLYSKYKYWHVGVSRDERFLTADTRCSGKFSEIILIDRISGEEIFVDKVATNKIHPCHPHPTISFDNSKIAYNSVDDLGNTCVKIAIL
ncbi:MAG: hypothetical protein IJY23_03915 [Clostridia bacterium]|nr:hypothetical protein [Clostridia bacterium]